MDRRLFGLALGLSCALEVVCTCHVCHAAQPNQAIVRVGFVSPVSLSPMQQTFWMRLRELGWEEGRNLVIETRTADGHYDRLPAIMTELVDRKMDVLVTFSTPAGIAAKNATRTIPESILLRADEVIR